MPKIIVKQLYGRGIEVPCVHSSDDMGPVPAKEFFPIRNPNVLLLARKNSGKTTIIYNIIKAYIRDLGKENLRVIIYCPSWNKNNVWHAITKLLDDNDIAYTAADFFKGVDANNKKYNHLETFSRMMSDGGRPEETYLMIYDDLGADMRNVVYTNLLAKNRHWNLVTLAACHSVVDVVQKTLNNYDYILAFPNITDARVEELHKKLSPSIPVEQFVQLYKKATDTPYNFLYYGAEPERYRFNFDRTIEIGEVDGDEE